VASPARRNIVNPRKKSIDVTLPGTGGFNVLVSEFILKRFSEIYDFLFITGKVNLFSHLKELFN
jgi:hypothetical protein